MNKYTINYSRRNIYITADDILTRQWPEPVWIVPRLLPTGLAILAGDPKIGKATGEPNGKTLDGEVEVEANKNNMQCLAKWHNAFQSEGKKSCAFFNNRLCLRSISSDIDLSVPGRAVLFDQLADLQAGKCAADGGNWLDPRQNRFFFMS